MKERVSWIDMAKGYGVLFVIYAHLGVDFLWTWMYSFHLPLFFFLSGYVFNANRKFTEFVAKKCKNILVPYFSLGIPMVLFEVVKSVYKGAFSEQAVLVLVRDYLLQRRLWTLWYIACLFWLNILFYILVKICKAEWQIAIVSVFMPILGLIYYKSGGPVLPWNVDVCAMAIPFFYVGYIYKCYGQNVDAKLENKNAKRTVFIVFALLNVLCWRLSLDETGLGLEMFQSNYGNPVFTYMAAFAGIICVVLISKKFVILPVRYIGENSMLYYAWHQSIFIPIVHKGLEMVGVKHNSSGNMLEATLYKLLCLIIVVGCITVCNWMMKKMKLDWLIGK